MKELVIKDLVVDAGQNQILKGLNLTIKSGDILALIGPNGHGKSTLLNVLMGNPTYRVESGSIFLDGEDITHLSPTERSKKGLFMAFQNPPEIEGVSSMDFFKLSINSHLEKPISLFNYYKALEDGYKKVKLDPSMKERSLNLGFSGGEKKRNEILQMNLLKPSIAFLDEIDSGLDVDALKTVGDNVMALKKEVGTTFVIISHYERLYERLKPNRTACIINGVVAVEGDGDLALKVATEGYHYLEKEYNVSIERKRTKVPLLEVCAVKDHYER